MAGAVLAAGAGLAVSEWRGGLAVALGLLVGSTNGFMARRSLSMGASFQLTSLGRLAALSAVGVGLGALIGMTYVPLVLIGLGAAQIVLAVVSTLTVVRA
jgi:hypothetical protein